MRTVRYLQLVALLGCALVSPRTTYAEGEALMPGGAAAVSRGGAIAAKPVDAATLLHNPAALTDLDGHQGHYGIDMQIDAICVQPYGYYGWGIVLPEQRPGQAPNLDVRRSEFGDPASTNYGRRPLDKVCNSGALVPTPQLAASLRVHPKLTLALGMLAPVLVTGSQWGGSDGTIAVGNGARPTPTRYTIVRSDVRFAFNPTFGAAYKATPWLSLGLALQIAMGAADGYQVMALRAGTSPSNDMMTKISASDYFVPTLIFGVYAKPNKYIRIGGTFNWSEGIDGSGELTFYTNQYHQGAVGDEFVQFENQPVKVSRVSAPAPIMATLAVRYRQPLPGVDDDAKDPLLSELWDVELDATYMGSGQVGMSTASVANDFQLQFRRANGEPQEPLDVKASDLSALSADRHGLDNYALRVGGSWTALPGTLQASAGAFYQSRSVEAAYVDVGNFGLARIGFGLGARVRLGPVDLTAAYSHIFQETLEVAPPNHEPREEGSDDPRRGFDQRVYEDGVLSERPLRDPRAPAPADADAIAAGRQTAIFESEDQRARVVNAGKYTAGFNVFSIAVTHRF
jgi:hypothetical protein